MSHESRTSAPPAESTVPTDDTSGAPEGRVGAPEVADASPDRDPSSGEADQEPTTGDPLQDLSDDSPHTELLAAVLADPRSRAELFADLLAAEAKRDEYLDDLRRSHAELENYRKRVLRDAALQRDHGRVDVVSALLESLDDLDRTEQAGAGSTDEALAKGVTLVSAKLRDALGSIGVERIDAVGVAFDPTVHEAVQQVPADEPHDEPQVAQVLRAGYRLGDRTLRAAMVVVSQ